MTQDEFDNTRFHIKMKVKYCGNTHKIAGVDFEERMICFFENDENRHSIIIEGTGLLVWAAYDECEIINS